MQNEYGFFTGKSGDRLYTAEDFCAFFGDFFTDGILAKNMESFHVCASGSMNIAVNGGTAYVKGKWYRKNAQQILRVPVSHTEYDRYDAVVIRCDYESRCITTDIVCGEPSADPVPPAPRRDENVYELVTAYILVRADSYEITDADITDTRLNNSLCGIVTSVIQSISTTELFTQFRTAWNDFVAQLGESDNVTIHTEDRESRRQVTQLREQMPFGSMFMMI